MLEDYQIFNDRILIEEIEDPIEEKTEGGIILPLETQERAERARNVFFGKVVMTGEKCELVKVGDIVIYNKSGGTLIPFGKELYYLMGEQMLLGKKK